MNVFYSNNCKYMLINLIKDDFISKYIPRKNDDLEYKDVILIISEDIYKDIKKELIELETTEKINIGQIICISFQDDAIKFYYEFQDYIVSNYISKDFNIKDYYVQSNYGLKLSYDFIKKKYINRMKCSSTINECNLNKYIEYREKNMSSDLIKFINAVICHPVEHKNINQKQILYFMEIKFENRYFISDKFQKFVGPLCISKEEAECEANLLLFKLLYHSGDIKLPVIEGRGLRCHGIPPSIESSFYCPDVFSKDSWVLNEEFYPDNFYNPNNLFFVSYLENDEIDDAKELFCYIDINKTDEQPNKIKLCLGYITKKPIPSNTPIIEIREYKNDKYKFHLKLWNKYNNQANNFNSCNDIFNKNHNNNDGDKFYSNDTILDNSDCQSYLPVYFSDDELETIKTFQTHSWKMLFGNNNLQPSESNNSQNEKLNEMYYIIPMSKKNNTVEINWNIMKNINTTMNNLQNENIITLGDWIYYANYFLKKSNKDIHYENNTFEENCYYLKEFHKKIINVQDIEKIIDINNEIEKMDEETQNIIEKSLKKVYLINKFDKTICFFTGLDRKARKEDVFILNKKTEEKKETTYQDFFEDKYKELVNDHFQYKYKNSPLFSYDAHSLIHSLQRDENDENGEKKNLYIPELYCVITVPQAWIKLLTLIPIFTYKIKILTFMDEFRCNIGLKHLTLESIYRASMSKSADPVVGEQHERLELLGDSILKYLTSLNILNCYFNRNEDLLIHRRNDFIKNEFLIEQINKLGWKKYSIKQRYSVKNFCPPNYDMKQTIGDLDKKPILKNKDDKSIADFYEALVGACFEDGIKSYKNGNIMFSIENICKEMPPLYRKDRAKALEEGIKLSKLFLIRTKNIFSDHWKWQPSSINKSIIKVNRKNMKFVSETLGHKFIENSSMFTIINYNKEMYSKYSLSDCKRLKFVGEAVLDLITVIYYYSTRVTAKPKELTEYKHMAVSKNSYAKLFASLDIIEKMKVEKRISHEYKKVKQSNNNENYPKYLSEIFEALIGSILIDNKYHFGKTNIELFEILKDKLYKIVEEGKNKFKVINDCIELIQHILKENKNKQGNIEIVGNQKVLFEIINGKMCMIVKDFSGKEVIFDEFAEIESSNAKRNIAKKIMDMKEKLGEDLFKFAVLKRLTMKLDKQILCDFWKKETFISEKTINNNLIEACKMNDENLVKYFIINGRPNIDINTRDKNGLTALHYECKTGNENIVKYLIEHFKDININVYDNNNNTPLHFACKQDNENIVKYLIECGANYDFKDKFGYTPLFYANKNKNTNIIQLLNALDVPPIIKACRDNNVDKVISLIEKGADVNITDNDGKTPLLIVCENKDPNMEIVEILVENKADINIKKDNKTITRILLEENKNKVAMFLLEKGAKFI